MEAALIMLVSLLIWQQYFWMRHTQKLVDKLMSRSYFDYETSKQKLSQKKSPVVLDEGPPEDFSVLEGVGLN